MAAWLYDFNGTDTADGSGVPVPAGHPPLVQVSGSWRRLNNRAYSPTYRYNDPILAMTDGIGNADLSLNVSTGGGDALYARVSDAANWIRLRVNSWTTSSTYTYYVTEYEWVREDTDTQYRLLVQEWGGSGGEFHFPVNYYTTWTYTPQSPDSYTYTHSHSGYGSHVMTHHEELETREVVYDRDYTWSTTSPGSGWSKTGSTRQSPRTGTDYDTHYGAWLEKCVGGAVTVLDSVTTSTISSIRLRVQDSSIEGFYNGNSTPSVSAADVFNSTVATHGVGRADSENNGQAIDNFQIDTLNTPANPPTSLIPADGALISLGFQVTFSWVFSDPDPGDTQGKFELHYRKVGEPSWTAIVSQTSLEQWNTGGDTFEPGTTYEWRVRTWDQTLSDPGPWSAIQTFSTIPLGHVVVDGALREVGSMWVIEGGAKKPISALSVIVGGAKKQVG